MTEEQIRVALAQSRKLGEAYGLAEAAALAIKWAATCSGAPEAAGALNMFASVLADIGQARGKTLEAELRASLVRKS